VVFGAYSGFLYISKNVDNECTYEEEVSHLSNTEICHGDNDEKGVGSSTVLMNRIDEGLIAMWWLRWSSTFRRLKDTLCWGWLVMTRIDEDHALVHTGGHPRS